MNADRGSDNLELVLDPGTHPPSDALLREEHLKLEEPHYPLTVSFCSDCGLCQIRENVAEDELFCNDYPYYSSFIPRCCGTRRRRTCY